MPERSALVVGAPSETGMDVDQGDGKIEEKAVEVTEESEGTQMAKDLHRLLMETMIHEGKLCCRACGHEYAVKEGIANFLLPSHLV